MNIFEKQIAHYDDFAYLIDVCSQETREEKNNIKNMGKNQFSEFLENVLEFTISPYFGTRCFNSGSPGHRYKVSPIKLKHFSKIIKIN